MKTLVERLAEISASEDQQEVEGWTVFRLITDPAHWAEVGITTAEQLDSYLDACAQQDSWDRDDDTLAKD
jgi:hypothetical protein